jgi:hypothetical protein
VLERDGRSFRVPASRLSRGQVKLVTLQASASTLNACNGGTEQYQFWLDGNLNGIVGDVATRSSAIGPTTRPSSMLHK